MKISLIAAAGDGNNAIGFKGKIPWHLPADFKRFKELTLGHPVIMGQKTFESMKKPLPDRTNVIITSDVDFCADHFEVNPHVTHSLDEALEVAQDADEVFIIGGGQIYRLAFLKAQKIYLTKVHGTFEGDVFFPEVSESEWRLVSSEDHAKDDKNAFDYTFCIYERKSLIRPDAS
jgi:dihydrofolate reductase